MPSVWRRRIASAWNICIYENNCNALNRSANVDGFDRELYGVAGGVSEMRAALRPGLVRLAMLYEIKVILNGLYSTFFCDFFFTFARKINKGT